MKALSIDQRGRVADVELARDRPRSGSILPALRSVLGCATVETVALDGGVNVWVDENGIAAGPAVNAPASLLAQELHGVPIPLRGTVVLTGFDPETGRAKALTGVQCAGIRRRLGVFAQAGARA